jgi:hypothetical protein
MACCHAYTRIIAPAFFALRFPFGAPVKRFAQGFAGLSPVSASEKVTGYLPFFATQVCVTVRRFVPEGVWGAQLGACNMIS